MATLGHDPVEPGRTAPEGSDERRIAMIAETPATAPATALVGRGAELGLLGSFVTDAASCGAALVLAGDAGVGKTALLDAAADAARSAGALVLRTGGVEFLVDLGFFGVRQVLLPIRDRLERLAPAQRAALARIVECGTDRPAHRLLVLNAVLDLLRAAAADRPVLVVADDLQRVDRASAATFAFVARRLAGSRVGFLAAVTSEPGVGSGTGVSEHRIPPLGEQAAAALLGERGPVLAAPVARRVLAEACGNPLAVLELPQALTDAQRRGLRPLPSVLPLTVPLRALFAARVADLPDRTRQLLLVAALADAVALRATGWGPERLDDLAAAERASLVRVDPHSGRIEFRHPLVRSTVVDLATGTERRRAHRALAELLTDRPAHRARHLADATADPDEQLADLLERTAHHTLGDGDAVGAVAALLRAADLGPRQEARGRRLAMAAQLGVTVTGDLHRVPALLVEAGHADPRHRRSLPAAVATAGLLLHGPADVTAAHRVLVDALLRERFHPGRPDPDEALQMLLTVCLAGGTAPMWQAAAAVSARVGTVAPELRLLVALLAEPARLSPADRDGLDTAIRGLDAEADPRRIVRVSTAALFTDRAADCRAALWRVVGSGRDGDAVAAAVGALTLLCVDDVRSGRWDECVRLAEEGVALCADRGYRLATVPLRLVGALVAAARGDRPAVRAVTEEVLAWTAPLGLHALSRYAHRVAALAALAEGDAESAYRHATAIGPPGSLAPHDVEAAWGAVDLVEAAVLTGRHDEAVRHVRALRAAALCAVSPRLAMVAAGAAALTAPPDGSATGLYEAALATPGGERWAFDHARIQLAYGAHLRRCRETGAARRQLRAALLTFRWLATEPWIARARDELRATGLPVEAVRSTAGRRGGPLTPEEHEVATLAATGLTNKQIAQRLHLSHRTVAARLHQAFPKLGLISRAGLRDALAVPSAARQPDSSASSAS